MVKVICQTCNEEFEATRKDKKYCTECFRKRRIQQVLLSRKKRNPDIEIGVGSGNATSNKPGHQNHNWKTGIQGYRRLVNKEKCSLCGSTTQLLVHHIDHNRYNNNLENLTIVCKKCHQTHHCKRDPKTGRFLAK